MSQNGNGVSLTPKRIIGYARVSTVEQNLAMQEVALRAAGITHYFEEKTSGAAQEREKLNEVLQLLRPGDSLVVYKLDRLSRSLVHLCNLMAFFQKNQISFISLHEHIDTTTPVGRMFFNMLGAIAEFERENIISRVRSGLDAAKRRGVKLGRNMTHGPDKIKQVQELLDENVPEYEIAKRVRVHRRTIARWRDEGLVVSRKRRYYQDQSPDIPEDKSPEENQT